MRQIGAGRDERLDGGEERQVVEGYKGRRRANLVTLAGVEVELSNVGERESRESCEGDI